MEQQLKNNDFLPNILKWFQSIDIKELSINDNIVKVVLNEDVLSVENKFFLLLSDKTDHNAGVEFAAVENTENAGIKTALIGFGLADDFECLLFGRT